MEAKRVRCSIAGCPVLFRKSGHMKAHAEAIHGSNKNKGKFTCDECMKRGASNWYLSRHQLQFHQEVYHQIPSSDPDNSPDSSSIDKIIKKAFDIQNSNDVKLIKLCGDLHKQIMHGQSKIHEEIPMKINPSKLAAYQQPADDDDDSGIKNKVPTTDNLINLDDDDDEIEMEPTRMDAETSADEQSDECSKSSDQPTQRRKPSEIPSINFAKDRIDQTLRMTFDKPIHRTRAMKILDILAEHDFSWDIHSLKLRYKDQVIMDSNIMEVLAYLIKCRTTKKMPIYLYGLPHLKDIDWSDLCAMKH